MVESKIQALDAVDEAALACKGLADALSDRACVDGDALCAVLARVADAQSASLRDVALWLGGAAAE